MPTNKPKAPIGGAPAPGPMTDRLKKVAKAKAQKQVDKANKSYFDGENYKRGMAAKSIPMALARGAAAEARAVKAAGARADGSISMKDYNDLNAGYAERDAAHRTSRDLRRITGEMVGPFETNINKPSASVQAMLRKKKKK